MVSPIVVEELLWLSLSWKETMRGNGRGHWNGVKKASEEEGVSRFDGNILGASFTLVAGRE
jgi:hypothetical protein